MRNTIEIRKCGEQYVAYVMLYPQVCGADSLVGLISDGFKGDLPELLRVEISHFPVNSMELLDNMHQRVRELHVFARDRKPNWRFVLH